MPIFQNIPESFYKCNDGTFSDHTRRGACNYHGGLKDKAPYPFCQPGSGPAKSDAGVVLVDLNDVHTNEQWFQNRAQAFSTRTVENIINAYREGNFKWVNFGPVTLWLHPTQNKLYVLSGHSRTEAFRQLCAMGAQVDGRDFCKIPAKIAERITLEEAQKIALESNTLSTKETPLERADYYRRLKAEGKSPQEMMKIARRLEGKDARTILAYSYLSRSGKTLNALQALQSGQAESKTVIENVARWIGAARMTIGQLTDRHENELYEWLVERKGYGTSRGQISNERDFKTRLQSIINRRSTFGRLEESLNIQAFMSLSPTESVYNAQLEEAKKQVKDLDKTLAQKVKDLRSRGATEQQINEITAGLVASLQRARVRLVDMMQKKGDVAQAARNELSLFAGIGQIVKAKCVGRTRCNDGTYSTRGPGRGVCASHGGWKQPAKPTPKKKAATKPAGTAICNSRGFAGQETFEYVLSALKKAGLQVNYKTTKSNSSINFWTIISPNKPIEGGYLELSVFNGAKNANWPPAFQITGPNKAYRFACTDAEKAIKKYIELYQQIQAPAKEVEKTTIGPAAYRPPVPGPTGPENQNPDNYYFINANNKAQLQFDKADYDALNPELRNKVKRYFLFSRRQAAWISKAKMPNWNVSNIIKELGLPFQGTTERRTFTQKKEDQRQRALTRAERLEARAEKYEQQGKSLQKERERYRGDISFWTQPLIPGHSGSRSFGRYRQRVIDNYMKGVQMEADAEQMRKSAAYARARAEQTDIADLEAGLVKKNLDNAQKDVTVYEKAVENWQKLVKKLQAGEKSNNYTLDEAIIRFNAAKDRYLTAIEKVAYYTDLLEKMQAQGMVIPDQTSLKNALYIRTKGNKDWYKVIRVNPKTVTHSWFVGSWKTDHYQIKDAVFPGDQFKIKPYMDQYGKVYSWLISDIQRKSNQKINGFKSRVV